MNLIVKKVFDKEWGEEVYLVFPASGEWPRGGAYKDDVRKQMIEDGYAPTKNYTFANPSNFGFDCDVCGWIWEIENTDA